MAPGDVHGDTEAHDPAPCRRTSKAHGSTWLFQVLSLRTVVAALAFFGLAGLAAQAAECTTFNTLLIAVAAGVGAMYAVYAMLRAMRSLRAEGTVRIQRAVGQQATVYLHIPAQQQGVGKVQINLQNRTMEYLATTARRRHSQRNDGRRHQDPRLRYRRGPSRGKSRDIRITKEHHV